MSTAKLDDSTQRPLYGERIIEESKIICFENPNKKRIYEISIQLPEFTCKCPFSGYPDFAKLNIIYQPNLKVYELKSLKLYIKFIEEYLEIPIKIISLGPERNQTIIR